MNTLGKHKWPKWIKKIFGKKKNIEIKEDKGRFYVYESKNIWDKEKKSPRRTSKYLGVVKPQGVVNPHEIVLRGIYEYGHVMFVYDILNKNGIIKPLKKIFPDWKTILAFALNRLIDPRPIKSMQSWYEKTYLVKFFGEEISSKRISRVLETIGISWGSQRDFFQELKQDGDKVLYDGSVIFSASQNNPLLEVGYNKEHLFLPKANIVMAFSHKRFLPIFFRIIPGSIHEITTIEILLEELGKDIILVMDKGFMSKKVTEQLDKKTKFIIPLKRNSGIIDYETKFRSAFMFNGRPIKYASYKHKKFYVYLYEDLDLRNAEEKTYFSLILKGKKAEFKENWAGKIAILSNMKMEPKEIYEMWKARDGIEKAFDILQNYLDTDRPYVRKEETFKGYLFCSFISLISYYLILKILKEAELNDKISVSDLLLELSKIYKLEINKKEIFSERSKKARKLMKALKIKNLITNSRRS